MKDILLDKSGDIALSKDGDIALVTSPVQAVLIRLRWFFREWVFDPDKGIPWYESILVKKPDIEGIRKMLVREIMEVEEVTEVPELKIYLDAARREAIIKFCFRTSENTYYEEVKLRG